LKFRSRGLLRSAAATVGALLDDSTIGSKLSPHAIWRGHLRLALVSCPIALYSANHDRGSLHFNLINPKTGNRIRMITQDAETEAPVSRGDLVKGYEFKKDTYLIMSDEDFESARIESSTTIKIEKFVERNSIDSIYFDASCYVAPDGSAGEDVYVVLRDAIASTGKVALSRVVIARREHPIALIPMGKGLVAHTLHEKRDLNDYSDLFDHLPSAKLEPEADEEPDRTNVVDLMSALRKSLGQSDEKPTSGKKTSSPKSSPRKVEASPKAKAASRKKSSPAGKPAARRRA
jgi:DNA end-binding protein Ku